jgi:hypothetical protein
VSPDEVEAGNHGLRDFRKQCEGRSLSAKRDSVHSFGCFGICADTKVDITAAARVSPSTSTEASNAGSPSRHSSK